MKSVRKALRQGELEKDTYDRLVCAECEKPLKTENDPETITTIRTCPDCEAEWKEIR
ncbi:HVO_0758 family zinc finger protein [Natrialbaceae archaeon GCM10025810]|uniref:HVO_0758 family zinc finger protein n=1 Tax=Halovalidus salilacus TaxID=3075124 RepID=UPI00360FC3AE